MSLNSAASGQCCIFTGGGLTPIQNPPPCGPRAPVFPDCDNLLGASVDAILTLATPGGATVDEILAQILVDCPNLFGTSTMEIRSAVDMGARRGVLKRVDRDGQTAYMVLSAMVQLNGHNTRYARPICSMYSSRRGTGTLAVGMVATESYSRCDNYRPNALDCSY